MRKFTQRIVLALTAGFVCSCASHDDLDLDPTVLDSLYIHKYEKAKKSKDPKLANVTPSFSHTSLCMKILHKAGPALQSLKAHIPFNEIKKTGFSRMADLSANNCSGRGKKKTIRTLTRAIRKHDGKIGVVLPLSGTYGHLGEAVLKGIRAQCESHTCNDRLVIKNSRGTARGTRKALAQILFRHDVALLISGLTKASAEVVVPLSKENHAAYLDPQ